MINKWGARGVGLACVAAFLLFAANASALSAAATDPSSIYNSLRSVSCPSATQCTAVGGTTGQGGIGVPLIEQWDGHSWTVVPSPYPSGSTESLLLSVSCPSTTMCMAVGISVGGSFFGSFGELWRADHWSVVDIAKNNTGPSMNSVSCATATSCVAVGALGSNNVTAYRWNGTRWSLARTGLPKGQTLTGVSCVKTTMCIAVGNGTPPPGAGSHTSFAEIWDGSTWTATAPPQRSSASQLSAVSCTSTTYCTAVGYAWDATAEPLIETWNGNTWARATAPTPGPDIATLQLEGVQCATPKRCAATGWYFQPGTQVAWSLAETWDGTAWKLARTPNPSQAPENGEGWTGNILWGTSCVPTGSCIAVGHYLDDASQVVHTITTTVGLVPGPPTITGATGGNGSATVTWNAPSNSGASAISSYDVMVLPTYPYLRVINVSAGTTHTTVTGLVNGDSYQFLVLPVNAQGIGSPSIASQVVTPS